MNLDVTSVAKEPEPYGQAPAAIDVITSDDIRRSGASSIPEALRLADNLDVAQKNSHDWAISARGFNTALGNKLLVLMDGRTCLYAAFFRRILGSCRIICWKTLTASKSSAARAARFGAPTRSTASSTSPPRARRTRRDFTWKAAAVRELRDFGGVRYGGTLASNVYFRVYGKYFDRGNEVYSNGNNAADSWQQGQGGFRIDDEASAQNHFTLQGDFYGGDENVRHGRQREGQAAAMSWAAGRTLFRTIRT